MKTTNTFGEKLVIRSSKSNCDKALVYARTSVDEKRVEISLKQTINPENWNNIKGVARGKTEEIKYLNAFIEEVRFGLSECY